jgi:DnaK suppressor protein
MAKATKTPAKPAKAPAKAATKPSAKAPAKAISNVAAKPTLKTSVKPATKATVQASAKSAPTKTAKAAPKKAVSANAGPTKTAPAKAAASKIVSGKESSAKSASAQSAPVKAAMEQSTSKSAVKSPAKSSSKHASAPPRLILPPRIIAPTVNPAEEYEDAFSDVPQEPEQFAPVPMASRLQRTAVRYSDSDLEMFRLHIETERKKAMEEFQILRENLEDLTNSEMADENASYSMHMAEQGTDAQEKEKLYAHVQRVSDYIKKLDEALQRIHDKIYGICKMCGILIAKERLLAVPITTQSASYKLRKRCPEDGIDRIVPVKR